MTAGLPDPSPRFPADRSGVAILGCGGIAQTAHLPAYQRHGVEVAGVWSRTPATVATVAERFPVVGRVYDDVDDLLSDPAVRIVDIATGPESRLEWIEAAVDAGKHVLAQKPLTTRADDLAGLERVLAKAAAAGLRVAVNHNGRWAPPWRLATLLVRQGAIGTVVGVTHVFDKPLPPLVGTHFDDLPHMLVTDHLMHWLDISRCWLEDGSPAQTRSGEVVAVQATDSRLPGQPAGSRNPWSATIQLTCAGGATASMRIAGNAVASEPGCPFWIHGTEGTLRGSVLFDSDRLSIDDGSQLTQLPVPGAWFVDGFAGTMGELMCAIDEGREPENSAAHVIGSVRLMLAAHESAEHDGAPAPVSGVGADATNAGGKP